MSWPSPASAGSRSTRAEAQPAGDLTIAIDDVLVAVADDESAIPVHASWHPIRLEVGPYVMDGELPTLPGYDPGRALTRPTASSCCCATSASGPRRAAATLGADRSRTRS